MKKGTLLRAGKDLDGFKVVEGQAPDGLSPQILWDLWDISVKFGNVFENGVSFRTLELAVDIYDYRGNNRGGTLGFTIAKNRSSGLMSEGVQMFDLQNGMNVMWDMGHTIADIQGFIKEIDDFAIKNGMKVEGQRITMLDTKEPRLERMSVKMFIDEPGAVMTVFPGFEAEDVINQFDHPELLAVIDQGPLKLICLKSGADQLAKEHEEKLKKLKELGIDQEKIADMSAEELLELKKLLDD